VPENKNSPGNGGVFVGLLGFEPRQTESKSVVLPLHHNPFKYPILLGSAKIRVVKKYAKCILDDQGCIKWLTAVN
jgi:hypothetical protein